MPYPQLNRFSLDVRPLAERKSKLRIERDAVNPDNPSQDCPPEVAASARECAKRIREARERKQTVMLAFGAHTIKNGLGPVLIRLMEEGWVTHLATNGAGIVHDWEFAFQGQTSEDVRANVAAGTFGLWQETGFTINLAILVGACEGKGYGESIGSLIETEGLTIPDPAVLAKAVCDQVQSNPAQSAAAADLLWAMQQFKLPAGRRKAPHPYKCYSAQAAAFRMGIPFTAHPMIGHDIIYEHPMNSCAAIGRAAERDFLRFAEGVTRLGVYLSVGSAVMSPMIFEKSMAMANNLAIQQGKKPLCPFIVVADLSEMRWDWSIGEPPQDSPDYYLRCNKSFCRMGGELRTIRADNRDFLTSLCRELSCGGAQ